MQKTILVSLGILLVGTHAAPMALPIQEMTVVHVKRDPATSHGTLSRVANRQGLRTVNNIGDQFLASKARVAAAQKALDDNYKEHARLSMDPDPTKEKQDRMKGLDDVVGQRDQDLEDANSAHDQLAGELRGRLGKFQATPMGRAAVAGTTHPGVRELMDSAAGDSAITGAEEVAASL